MSKLIDKKLSDYINDVDSSLPAPGGGSVMGAVGSLACALAGMVGYLTVNKKKFLELSQQEQDNFNNAIENIRNIKCRLMEIVDKDAESFNAFMEAMKLPKDTEEEKTKRKNAISEAAKKAIDVPFNALKSCYELMPFFETVIKYGNNNVITDIASAYILAFACAKGSVLNININIPLIEDNVFLNDIKTNTEKYINTVENNFYNIEKQILLFRI
ncbi:Formiminotransferase-cyclodeaminase [Brachyspira hampsonii 30446]|uniref:Formiminotransferase-cyclodeaminase n=1 Tax=Brachyspira hampsonii 30446 TaxID=1289135 RepID=A0A2U4EVC6_9SPIR|nr:cyclodeaminase/cyclohydrolase family protein [Brachyspira hampsonii]EKV56705.1 Formiminotransferase-cyclodeaminase [Brachyspira hampsonii 30446]MBW5393714.1 formiminotransferase-cyclodeaminase [Brachyspira hampsonii]